jgi:hypothetical protein
MIVYEKYSVKNEQVIEPDLGNYKIDDLNNKVKSLI